MRFQLLTLFVLMLVVHAGCSFVDSEKTSKEKSLDQVVDAATSDDSKTRGPSQQKVRWDGGGVFLGQADNLAFTPSDFRQRVSQLLGDERRGEANYLIHRYPDVALLTLQRADFETQELQALQFIGASLDRNMVPNKNGIWSQFVRELSAATRKSEDLNRMRQKFWQYLETNEPDQALKLGLLKQVDQKASPMLKVDCLRMEALALMMNGQTSNAIRRIRSAIGISDTTFVYLGTHLRLLLGEFYRHNKELDAWRKTWELAVQRHSELLARKNVLDPEFWNRAAYLRPAKTNWPSAAIQNHRRYMANNAVRPHTAESVIWCSTGYQHLERGEGQNAILSFKKSESTAQTSDTRDHLRLQQARAMILAGQPGPASAIMMQLVAKVEKKQDPNRLGDRCKSILGSMKLQNGGIEQGLSLIQASVKSVEHWPRDERLKAQADYALALLMRGRQEEGIPLLSEVHRQFSHSGHWHQAHQCLWNMAKFYEKTDQKGEYRETLQRLEEFEDAVAN